MQGQSSEHNNSNTPTGPDTIKQRYLDNEGT